MRTRPSPLRTTVVALLSTALVVPVSLLASGPAGAAVDDPLPEPVVVLDDFEDGQLPRVSDPDGNAIGVFEFSGDGYAYSYVGAGTTPPWTPSPGGGESLVLGSNTGSFAGLIRIFTGGDPVDWAPVDASASAGFSVRFFGTGSGTGMFLDLLDNRSAGSTRDDAGRWTVSWIDDTPGWRTLSWEWDEFAFKNIGNGAPDDGLTLEEINGYGFGTLGTGGGERQFAFDDVALFGERPLTVAFDPPVTRVGEGETAEPRIRLSRATDRDVTVDWATSDSTDRTATEDVVATPDRDYVPSSGTVTIPAGERDAFLSIPGVQDDTWEVDESYQVVLTDTDGLPGGPATRGVVSLADDDPRDPALVEDGQQPGLLEAGPRATVGVTEVEVGDALARPGQQYTEDVVTGRGPGTIGRTFAEPQDFSGSEGLSFWYRGTGSRGRVQLELADNSAPDPGPDGWELKWSDDFDGPAGSLPDPDKWSFETGGWGWGNQELQYYAEGPEHASLDGQGNLVIRTAEVEDPEAADLPCWYGPCEYTSARLVTEGNAEFRYGRIEARVKAPAGTGIWPAFWSLGNDFRDVGWPTTGEIDFYEFVGREPFDVFGTIHGPGYSGGESFGDTITLDRPVPEEFHTITTEWQPGLIEWYLDGVKFHEATPEDVAPNGWPFDKPYTLLLNTALGGNFGGALGADLELPGEYLVDYVEVFGAPDTAERFTASFQDTSGWQQVTVPWSSFRRDRQQPAGAPDDGLTLTEVDGWSLRTPGRTPFHLDDVRLVD
ncbi:family 16 glycosylhydrolase [Jannaschia sp. R86511]|uniref:family 16 glycosylhydrolase n=1 Tax=Jannaschia sp. R86511 TaxID=3093853 RepID=UPI0036D3C69A